MGIIQSCCTREKEGKNDLKAQTNLRKLTGEEKQKGDVSEDKEKNLSINYTSNSKKVYLSIPSDVNNSYIVVALQILSRLAYFRDFLSVMGKAVKDKTNFFKDFITLLNCISTGEACEEEFGRVIDEFRSFEFREPMRFIEITLCKIHFALYRQELNFSDYKLGYENTSTKTLNEVKDKFSKEFYSDIKNKFYTGYLSIRSRKCRGVKCGYKSVDINSESFWYLKMDKFDTSLQQEIELRFNDQFHPGNCEKCGKESNSFISINRILINIPKYLFILLDGKGNWDDISSLKKQPLCYFRKYYELFSIISYSDIGSLYSCLIKIDYKWISFKEDTISLINQYENLDDCYAIVLQMK